MLKTTYELSFTHEHSQKCWYNNFTKIVNLRKFTVKFAVYYNIFNLRYGVMCATD